MEQNNPASTDDPALEWAIPKINTVSDERKCRSWKKYFSIVKVVFSIIYKIL